MTKIILGKNRHKYEVGTVVPTKDFDWRTDLTTYMPDKYWWYVLDSTPQSGLVLAVGSIFDVAGHLSSLFHAEIEPFGSDLIFDPKKCVAEGKIAVAVHSNKIVAGKHCIALGEYCSESIAGDYSIAVGGGGGGIASAGKEGIAVIEGDGIAKTGHNGSVCFYPTLFTYTLTNGSDSKTATMGENGFIANVKYELNNNEIRVCENFLLQHGLVFFFRRLNKNQVYQILSKQNIEFLKKNKLRLYKDLTRNQKHQVDAYIDMMVLAI